MGGEMHILHRNTLPKFWNWSIQTGTYYRDFFYTFEKTQGEKNLNFSAFGRKLKPYFFKNPKLLEILSTCQFFFKKSQHFLSSKRHFLCMFNPKVDKNCAKRAKKSIFPPIFAWNNCFSLETQAIWKKLKQLLGKTQENIQKLK